MAPLHCESQNPRYVSVLSPLLAAAMAVGAVMTWPVLPWLLPVYALGFLVAAAMFGGLRVSVTSDRLVVQLGVFGLPLVRIPLADIQHMEVVEFRPLRDFGGWGIRYSLRLKAMGYFLRGRRGVMIHTKAGKRRLVGSDDPLRLAAALAGAGGHGAPGT
jgi:hypothetical protein